METFVWVIAAACVLDVLTILHMLASGKITQRTPATLVISAVIGIAWIVWAAVLLS